MTKPAKRSLAVALVLCLFAAWANAQTYPSRSIRIVVPLAAGGPGDILARAIGQKLAESVGQPIVIDNRPGANTNIGTEAVAKSAPDGYTLLLTASTHTINPSLYSKLPFDPIRDFAPVTLVGDTPLVMVLHPSVPATSVKAFIALAKSRPGQINYGSAGSGSTLHLAGEMFNSLAGVKMVHVPYKGVTQAVSDLLGGHLTLMFPGAPIALPHARAGKLVALATTGTRRTPAAPELPTVAEAGVPGFEVTVWYGVLAPAATPQAVITRLHGELVRIVQLPDIRERWATLGADPLTNTPTEFAAFLKADIGKWAKVVKESGAKAD
ncbi:MAG TPA: tripartite tricarboxylate transporter substrate binding protein [Burkholderiales bacterium]|nr:tripartite tricarboxylate transporter substrate binding protein [Burkholderiales bacterium]